MRRKITFDLKLTKAMTDTDEHVAKQVTRPKVGKGDLQRRGGRKNYERNFDRTFPPKNPRKTTLKLTQAELRHDEKKKNAL